ncbi:MAG TPA: histidine kinase dimerization/phospho-acceptor domain-containing protein, partial [Longimicrobiales bacterium]
MIDTQLAASISFVAFGINFFGAVLLLLLNSGSRSVRWYLPFQLCVILWLLSSAAWYQFHNPVWLDWTVFAVALMPLMFFLFAVMESTNRPAWQAMLVMLIAAPFIPLIMSGFFVGELSRATDMLALAWSVLGWIGASLLLWLQARRKAREQAGQPEVRKRIILLAFVLIAPICVAGAILLKGDWFITFAMPVITSCIMFLIFYGMTRLQFYDIEVRARRSGDIAAQTIETERLAVLGELTATIAHEVRNPLTGVRSLAQRIAADEIGSDKRKQYAEVILEETSRVENLVSNLLDLSRKSALAHTATPATTLLAPLFTDLALLVSSRAAAKQLVINTQADHGMTVDAPREVVAQAVLNLLLNAIAHAPPGTQVDVVAQRRDGSAEIIVRDRGPGIPSADRERIFEPF